MEHIFYYPGNSNWKWTIYSHPIPFLWMIVPISAESHFKSIVLKLFKMLPKPANLALKESRNVLNHFPYFKKIEHKINPSSSPVSRIQAQSTEKNVPISISFQKSVPMDVWVDYKILPVLYGEVARSAGGVGCVDPTYTMYSSINTVEFRRHCVPDPLSPGSDGWILFMAYYLFPFQRIV